MDFELGFTKAEFTNEVDDEIPNSVGRVFTAGAPVDFLSGIFGALCLRHFNDVPLIEDGVSKRDRPISKGAIIGAKT